MQSKMSACSYTCDSLSLIWCHENVTNFYNNDVIELLSVFPMATNFAMPHNKIDLKPLYTH